MRIQTPDSPNIEWIEINCPMYIWVKFRYGINGVRVFKFTKEIVNPETLESQVKAFGVEMDRIEEKLNGRCDSIYDIFKRLSGEIHKLENKIKEKADPELIFGPGGDINEDN